MKRVLTVKPVKAPPDADKTKDKVDFSGAPQLTSTGVKRTSEEEGASKKPDLKKIRVFAPTADDTVKRDVVAVKEFNQHLDQASKKLEEAGKENKDLKMLNELRNCFNNVPTGSGILNSLAEWGGSGSTGLSQ
ncbi:uncharacterized protein LOC121856509 [Homarus americanus]|uniref:Putative activating transcription factor 7-interacting protein 1-like n=1 Tax=Homarus americanus TaxID=6706 RepID=A0A8J5MK72_HOMAM|nr:uncharacterized protein LOC121856509 [Homarus americanus]KAG7154252.1 putative activating transcription factor 7-interacting protein 1-like [Homarus americanus]